MPTPAPSLRRLARRLAVRRRVRTAASWPYRVGDVGPPPVPAGWVVAPPDFVGVGAQKAGTTWWHGLVADHPQIHARADVPKELHFFERFWAEPLGDEDVAAYHRWFARPAGMLSGEWTPRYLYDFWAPPLLARAAPDAKLLVLLRDPVERYRSGMARDRSRGAPSVPLVAQDAFHRGLYGAQLARLLRHVDRERLLVLQYERCVAGPHVELERTYRFLGVDPSHRPGRLREQVGARVPKVELPGHALRSLQAAYRSDAEVLFGLFPELDPSLWSLGVGASPTERS